MKRNAQVDMGFCTAKCPATIVHIPHASTVVPECIRPTLCLTDDQLQHELLIMTELKVAQINALLMCFSSMAAPVYDKETGGLRLCSVVPIHEGNRGWLAPLLSLAALLQIAEVRIVGPTLAKTLGARFAKSKHPKNGRRRQPDELADIVATLVSPAGQRPCAWSAAEFQQAVDQYMQQPPSLLASAGGLGLTVEFPYGEASSLCRFFGDQPHPRYGNGLLILQSFPISGLGDSEGAHLALHLNTVQLRDHPSGYGFGSYCHRDKMIRFTSFLPNAGYRPNLLPNLYFGCAMRARRLSGMLTDNDWTEPNKRRRRPRSQSPVVRLLEALKASSLRSPCMRTKEAVVPSKPSSARVSRCFSSTAPRAISLRPRG